MNELAKVECEMASSDLLFCATTLELMASTPGLEEVIRAERSRILEARDKLDQFLAKTREFA